MSGIAGIIRWDGGPVSNELLEAMQIVLRHRGAESSVWRSESAGLVYLGSSSTRGSRSELHSSRSDAAPFVITADARLDNREELLDGLGIPDGHLTDSAIILRAYEKWAEDCPAHLLGDFAFAIWDPRRKELFCARDPMGIRPFCYFESPDCFVFGSEIKAILQVSDAPRRLDETTVGDFLCHVFEDREMTFYRGVHRLPPGCSLTVRAGHAKTAAHWRPDSTREIRLRSDHEYAEAFRAIFREAVRCRLRSEHPVGSTLSGGLDSSSIACTARDLLKQSNREPLHTFSAIFPGLPETQLSRIDERSYIAAVVGMGGVAPHYVEADRISPLADLGPLLRLNDQPVFAPNLYIHRALYEAARERGVRVMLDGFDGDTTVSYGFDYLGELLWSGHWISLAKESAALSRQYQSAPADVIWRLAIRPSVPERFVRLWRTLRGQRQPEAHEMAFMNQDFVRRIGLAERLNSLARPPALLPRSGRENHLESIRSPLLTYALEAADRSAAAFSLETRFPFFDRRLIEFSLGLPLSQKLSGGWTRVVLRRAMEGILPPEVQWRHTKADLSPNFVHGFLKAGRDALQRALVDDASLIEPYMNLSALRQMFEKNVAAKRKSSEDALTLFGVVMLSNWLREAQVFA